MVCQTSYVTDSYYVGIYLDVSTNLWWCDIYIYLYAMAYLYESVMIYGDLWLPKWCEFKFEFTVNLNLKLVQFKFECRLIFDGPQWANSIVQLG